MSASSKPVEKCGCSMTTREILLASIAHQNPQKCLLIVDHGDGWDITAYGPDSAGWPPRDGERDCITIQAALERIEEELVLLRRQSNVEPTGVVLTGEAMADALAGK